MQNRLTQELTRGVNLALRLADPGAYRDWQMRPSYPVFANALADPGAYLGFTIMFADSERTLSGQQRELAEELTWGWPI